MTVNFDNAATTFPKPRSVAAAVSAAISKYGGNAGRGGHVLTARTSEKVFDTRQAAADFFGAQAENVIFTLNCTHALNMAIKGIMYGGGHIIISGIEHNSVSRPVYTMASHKQISFSIAEVTDSDEETAENFRRLIKPNTKAVACTLAGNVTGRILPFRKIAEICREHDICFIADGAQACGTLEIKLADGFNILCTAGHKGLYGPSGTGLLISDGKYPLSTIIEGGAGSSSLSLEQPGFLPDALESGTLNTVGIIGLKPGIDFVRRMTPRRIFKHEDEICRRFINRLDPDYVAIYRTPGVNYAPVVSFNIKNVPPEEAAAALSRKGYCLRAGLHCAPLAHKALGTENGTVRFSPSIFNNRAQADSLAEEIKKIYKSC